MFNNERDRVNGLLVDAATGPVIVTPPAWDCNSLFRIAGKYMFQTLGSNIMT